jgi:hypothetical protein
MKNNKILFNICLFFTAIIFFTGSSSSRFNKSQVKRMEKAALQGDLKSSYTITDFYGIDLQDLDKQEFWQCIWFENNNVSGAWNYANINYMNAKKSLRFQYLYFLCEEEMCSRESLFKEKTKQDYREAHQKYPDFYFADDNLKFEEINETTFQYFYDEACSGSGLAALRLAQYYENKTTENLYEKYPRLLEFGKKYNPDEENHSLFWYRIGSQNGNKECMKKYSEILSRSKDKYDNIRAEFWKRKSFE